MISLRLAVLAVALLFSACVHHRPVHHETTKSSFVSGSMGIGVSSGGYGRHRHP